MAKTIVGRIWRLLISLLVGFMLLAPTISYSSSNPQTSLTITPKWSYGNGYVYDVAWSADETLMAVASTANLRIFDVSNLAGIQPITEIQGDFDDAEFSADGRYIATLAWTDLGTDIVILDIKEAKVHGRWTVPPETGFIVTDFAFSSDGRSVAVVSVEDLVVVWDVMTQTQLSITQFDWVNKIWFNADNELFVENSLPDEQPSELWRVTKDTEELMLTYPDKSWISNIYMQNSQFFMAWSAYDSSMVRIVDLSTNESHFQLDTPANIRQILYLEKMNQLLIYHEKGITIASLDDGTITQEIKKEFSSNPSFSPNGTLFSFVENTKFYLWDMQRDTEILKIQDYMGFISVDLQFHPSENMLVAGYNSRSRQPILRFWDMDNFPETYEDIVTEQTVRSIDFLAEDVSLLYTYSNITYKYGVSQTDLSSNETTNLFTEECDADISCWFSHIELSSDKELALMISHYSSFISLHMGWGSAGYVINTNQLSDWLDFSYEETFDYRLPLEIFYVGGNRHNLIATFRPETHQVAYTTVSGYIIELFNTDTRVITAEYHGHQAEIRKLEFSSDGRTLYSADESGLLIKWDVPQYHKTLKLEVGESPITDIAVHPSGQYVVVTSGDEIVILDTDTLEQVTVLDHTAVQYLDFNADGTLLASASLGGRLNLWEVEIN